MNKCIGWYNYCTLLKNKWMGINNLNVSDGINTALYERINGQVGEIMKTESLVKVMHMILTETMLKKKSKRPPR